ncbi:MAG: hypothetical protein IT439_08655 [Phycisphaerales bacterium]|nr:hypothetical protein [Phycisphaerales bacterium]
MAFTFDLTPPPPVSTLKTIHRALFDPGWLFLLPGVTLLSAAVLIPQHDRLAEVRWQAERMQVVAEHARERQTRYETFSRALEARDPALLRSLAASQLNLLPEDRAPLIPGDSLPPASVFPALEPPPVTPPELRKSTSRLHALIVDPGTRTWVLAGAILAIMIGLLPRTERAADLPPVAT